MDKPLRVIRADVEQVRVDAAYYEDRAACGRVDLVLRRGDAYIVQPGPCVVLQGEGVERVIAALDKVRAAEREFAKAEEANARAYKAQQEAAAAVCAMRLRLRDMLADL